MKTTILKSLLLILISACNISVKTPENDDSSSGGDRPHMQVQEAKYECIYENAFNLEQPINIMFTLTQSAGHLFIETAVCEVIDPATGAQLAVNEDEGDWCTVDYLDYGITMEAGNRFTAQMFDGHYDRSIQFSSCEQIY